MTVNGPTADASRQIEEKLHDEVSEPSMTSNLSSLVENAQKRKNNSSTDGSQIEEELNEDETAKLVSMTSDLPSSIENA